jgi:hypothetical protein
MMMMGEKEVVGNTAPVTQATGEEALASPGDSMTFLIQKIEEIIDQMGIFEKQKEELKTCVGWIFYNAEVVESNGWIKIKSQYLSTSPMTKVIGLEKKIKYVLAKLFNSPFRMDYQDRHYVILYIKSNPTVLQLLLSKSSEQI